MLLLTLKNRLSILFTLLLGILASEPGRADTNPWASVSRPTSAKPRAIGHYSGGCLHGGVSLLADEGKHPFQLMRKSRKRYYTHPKMRDFVLDLSRWVKLNKHGKLLVGDMGQSRGGPLVGGHSSHQTGLDGDFWFWLDSPAKKRRLSKRETDSLSARSMLTSRQDGVHRMRFKKKHVKMLEYAAKKDEVERIFVHPRIKKELCERTKQAAWLNKVRPWWGHHYHFHVRLKCPPGSPGCAAQEPVPAGPDCGENLAWWFSEDAQKSLQESIANSRKLSPAEQLAQKLARLPDKCEAVLSHGRPGRPTPKSAKSQIKLTGSPSVN